MSINKLFECLQFNANKAAIYEQDETYLYRDLIAAVEQWTLKLEGNEFFGMQVVAVQSDFSFQTIALILALFRRGMVVALISPSAKNIQIYCEDAQVEYLFSDCQGELKGTKLQTGNDKKHPLLNTLLERQLSGFIIFSSGTTGRPKAILHKLESFLSSYEGVQKAYCTLSFLLLDHIAGLDTLFYTLFSGGILALPSGRAPAAVCKLIEDRQVEVLPVSPSFLNLLILSGEYQCHDLSSLKVVSYGSEPINNNVLLKLPSIFPQARIIQKYGTSEFGSPRSKTREDDSAWMKLDSKNFKTKIVDDILWVKARSSMLGYLNAEGMLEKDGWLCTGDMVEVDGDWMRIIGRKSDIINVGGEKVFPVEVESTINELSDVIDAIVYGESHPILGNQVCVKVRCEPGIETKALKKVIRLHCLEKLERFKVPSKYEFVTESLTNTREKKQRSLI